MWVKLCRATSVVSVLGVVCLNLFKPIAVWANDVSPNYFIDNQQYNNLISNEEFIDINSMSVQAIQQFLVSQGSYLANAPASQLGEGANGRSAAQIIWDVARANYSISPWKGIVINQSTGTVSPKVILITLQKEQSLITKGNHDQRALDCAMGYENGRGCQWMFDNKPSWKGFTNQLQMGAWQLRFNYEIAIKDPPWWEANYPGQFQYRVGNGRSMSYNFHNPPLSGTVSVIFTNQATASLYRYTPYITYGNYNFWRFSRSWFGMSGGSGIGWSFNDTSSVELNTYGRAVKVQSAKESNTRIYLNGNLIADIGATNWTHQFEPAFGRNVYRYEYRNTGGGLLGIKEVIIERRKPGDIDGSGRVDLADLSIISNIWGQTIIGQDWRNLNPEVDNEINLLDLSIFANSWEG